MREMTEGTQAMIADLEIILEEETRVLIEDGPFYRAFPPEKFKISVDRKSKTVSVS